MLRIADCSADSHAASGSERITLRGPLSALSAYHALICKHLLACELRASSTQLTCLRLGDL